MPKHPIRLISVNAGLVRGEPGLAANLDKPFADGQAIRFLKR